MLKILLAVLLFFPGLAFSQNQDQPNNFPESPKVSAPPSPAAIIVFSKKWRLTQDLPGSPDTSCNAGPVFVIPAAGMYRVSLAGYVIYNPPPQGGGPYAFITLNDSCNRGSPAYMEAQGSAGFGFPGSQQPSAFAWTGILPAGAPITIYTAGVAAVGAPVDLFLTIEKLQ